MLQKHCRTEDHVRHIELPEIQKLLPTDDVDDELERFLLRLKDL